MKNYKNYNLEIIGASDKACLTIVTSTEKAKLYFGEDGTYRAYMTDENVEIPAHYRLVYETNNGWLELHDDDGISKRLFGKEIKIYRAGEFGCLIQVIK